MNPFKKKNKLIKGTNSTGENITMGENVSFGGNVCLYGTAPITIGDHTMIAYGVTIHTSTHDHNNHPMFIERIDRPINIGKHVWVGTGAIILPGVKIDDYAVIGAGAIVNKNIPKGAIAVGNPARIIKYRNLSMVNERDKKNKAYITQRGFLEEDAKEDLK